jgi:hypothetical protein
VYGVACSGVRWNRSAFERSNHQVDRPAQNGDFFRLNGGEHGQAELIAPKLAVGLSVDDAIWAKHLGHRCCPDEVIEVNSGDDVASGPHSLAHVDIKELGRIPEGDGWRVKGHMEGMKDKRSENKTLRASYGFIHLAVEDLSRLAYSEILSDEKKGTASALCNRVATWLKAHAVILREVFSDNGACSRSAAF